MLALAPKKILPPSLNDDPQVFLSQKPEIKKRVALMTGCAQKVLDTDINDATIRILRRMGCEVVIVKGQGCCGALTHHIGETDKALQLALPALSINYVKIEEGKAVLTGKIEDQP